MKKGWIAHLSLAALVLGLVLGTSPSAGAQERGSKAFLGVLAKPPAEKADEPGVMIHDVAPDSPAAKAGLKDGDRIVKAGDAEVKDFEALAKVVAAHKPGDEVAFQVVRDGKEQTINVTIGERPERARVRDAERPARKQQAFLGIQTQELTPDLKKHLDVAVEKGVVVTDVMPNTPAAKAGLKQEDVITAFGDTAVTSPKELQDAVRKTEVGKEVMLKVVRGKEKMELKARVEGAPAGFGALPPEFERLLPESGRRFQTRMPAFFGSAEKVEELEGKVKELEKRIRDLEQKLAQPAK